MVCRAILPALRVSIVPELYRNQIGNRTYFSSAWIHAGEFFEKKTYPINLSDIEIGTDNIRPSRKTRRAGISPRMCIFRHRHDFEPGGILWQKIKIEPQRDCLVSIDIRTSRTSHSGVMGIQFQGIFSLGPLIADNCLDMIRQHPAGSQDETINV